MPERARLDGDIVPIEESDDYVWLAEYGGSTDGYEPVTVSVDQFETFVEKCRAMGWEHVRFHVRDNAPVLAKEQGDASGSTYVTLAPMLVDGDGDTVDGDGGGGGGW